MKEEIKKWIFNFVYQLYKNHILHNKIKVLSMDETIEELLHSQKSIVRFGDAEIRMMEGKTVEFQDYDSRLSACLQEILYERHKDLMVAIPDIFENLELYTLESKAFWKMHLFFSRKTYEKYCNINQKYYNAFLSRPYYIFKDKELCKGWVNKIKKLWEDKAVVVVEGIVSHNGVDNDLLNNVKYLERILCPSQSAYRIYGKIKETCLQYPKDNLFLISLGNTAKILTLDLVKEGYRVIDIGNLDMEYQWCLQNTQGKESLAKHRCITREENEAAGYHQYLQQVKYILD